MTETEAMEICRSAFADVRRIHGGNEAAVNKEIAERARRDRVLMSALFVMARERAAQEKVE